MREDNTAALGPIETSEALLGRTEKSRRRSSADLSVVYFNNFVWRSLQEISDLQIFVDRGTIYSEMPTNDLSPLAIRALSNARGVTLDEGVESEKQRGRDAGESLSRDTSIRREPTHRQLE